MERKRLLGLEEELTIIEYSGKRNREEDAVGKGHTWNIEESTSPDLKWSSELARQTKKELKQSYHRVSEQNE